MPFSNEIRAGSSGQSTGFYNGVVSRSLRVNDGDGNALVKTCESSVTNRKKFTISTWIKPTFVTGLTSSGSGRKFGGFGSSVGSGQYGQIGIYEDELRVFEYPTTRLNLKTTKMLRDRSAWYSIIVVVDTTESTAADRAKVYINGVQITEFQTAVYYSQDFDTYWNIGDGTSNHFVGTSGATNGLKYMPFDGYIADYYFIDGSAVAYTEFGEFKNGVWIAKEYSGSFGINGWHHKFLETGTSANSSGIGADTSGNDNHFTVDGFVAADIVPDCPEKNMPIWNFLVNRRNGNTATFSEGNTKVAGHSSQVAHTSSTIASKGKHYAEFYINNSSYAVTSCGVVRTMWDNGMGDSYASNYGGAYYSTNGTRAYNATSDSQTAPSSNRVGIEVDFAANEVQFFICESDGTKTAAGDKLTSSDGINFAGEGVFTATTHDVSSSYIEAYFSESDWYCTPASGYVELSSTNSIDDTDIVLGAHQAEQPDDHFNVILYTSSGAGSYTGLGFQPDLVWVKDRGVEQSNGLFDSSRGVGKVLNSDATNAENDSEGVTSFDSDGYTMGTYYNQSTRNYVSWSWKANGATTTTNDASATSIGTIDSVYQANTKAGFSIITYTGSGSTGSIAHGLGVRPAFLMIKQLNESRNWMVFHKNYQDNYFTLNATDGAAGGYYGTGDDFDANYTTTTLKWEGATTEVNKSTGTYVCYAWAGVEGYSKFDSYEGTGSATNSPFIYTGFKPALVMCKSAGTENWIVVDDQRPGYNPTGNYLYWNLSNTEGGTGAQDEYIDLMSNGFKLRTTGASANSSGVIYIYAAWAHHPFKYNNAR